MPPRSVFVPRFRLSRLEEEMLDLLSPRERADIVAMLPFATPMLGGAPFLSFSTVYTTAQLVTVPAGATAAVIEGYGGGGYGSSVTSTYTFYNGGSGGHYSRKKQSLSGVTALYVAPGVGGTSATNAGLGGPSIVRLTSSSGSIIMQAAGGGEGKASSTANGTDIGDVSYAGGTGPGGSNSSQNITYGGGGGCAGPNGAGGNSSNGNAGVGGGGLAGNGGTGGSSGINTVGNVYGGGGGSGKAGAAGAIKITWS